MRPQQKMYRQVEVSSTNTAPNVIPSAIPTHIPISPISVPGFEALTIDGIGVVLVGLGAVLVRLAVGRGSEVGNRGSEESEMVGNALIIITG